jgi:hypothetical protein
MTHSLPRSRAQAWRVPMSGLPTVWLHAAIGSSASTQVIERWMVPCCGMGSKGFVAQAPRAAQSAAMTAAFLIVLIRLSVLLKAGLQHLEG